MSIFGKKPSSPSKELTKSRTKTYVYTLKKGNITITMTGNADELADMRDVLLETADMVTADIEDNNTIVMARAEEAQREVEDERLHQGADKVL